MVCWETFQNTGAIPFEAFLKQNEKKHTQVFMEEIIHDDLRPDLSDDVLYPGSIKELISALWQKDPAARPSFAVCVMFLKELQTRPENFKVADGLLNSLRLRDRFANRRSMSIDQQEESAEDLERPHRRRTLFGKVNISKHLKDDDDQLKIGRRGSVVSRPSAQQQPAMTTSSPAIPMLAKKKKSLIGVRRNTSGDPVPMINKRRGSQPEPRKARVNLAEGQARSKSGDLQWKKGISPRDSPRDSSPSSLVGSPRSVVGSPVLYATGKVPSERGSGGRSSRRQELKKSEKEGQLRNSFDRNSPAMPIRRPRSPPNVEPPSPREKATSPRNRSTETVVSPVRRYVISFFFV
jgi:hypothetical protein